MKSILTFLIIVGLAEPKGYLLNGENIHFVYPTTDTGLNVFVSGNFNSWSSADDWRATFESGVGYVLIKPIRSIQKPGKTFYEFTFRVNGKLIDANAAAPNVIHCAGYGSRYTINF